MISAEGTYSVERDTAQAEESGCLRPGGFVEWAYGRYEINKSQDGLLR